MILTLASASPRRRELLGQLGYTLRIQPADVDETPQEGEDAVGYALRVACAKARLAPEPALAADTVVHLEGRLYGKPRDAAHAREMLRVLSGRVHLVTTATCLRFGGQQRLRAVTTRVRFRALADAEIAGYVATGEPMDKAGGYGIQGVGGFLVASIEGSYSNVVGLPLAEVLEDLAEAGFPLPLSRGTRP